MTKKTTYLLGMFLTIIVGTLLYQKFCCNCNCKNDKSIKETQVAASGDVAAGNWGSMRLEAEGLKFNTQQNFNFKENAFNYLSPIGDSVNLGIDALRKSFEKNPNQKLLITGFCNANENNTSVFENLGFARANEVKKHLVNQGLSSEKLEINGVINDAILAKDSIYSGPISFEVTKVELNTPTEDWAALKEKININPLTIYFNTNQSELNLNDSERKQIADIQRYLDHVADAKLLITGHTDNVGNREANVRLSKSRAEFLKQKLESNGIDVSKILTDGKGPDEPITNNATAEAKAKNRRSVLIIK